MSRAEIRTRTRRQMMPSVSPSVIAGGIMLAEFAAFALNTGQMSMVIRSFLVGLPLLFFIARRPVIGIYALTFLIPLELFARIPNEFFSLYKLLGLLTLTSTVVHAAAGHRSAGIRPSSLHRWVFAFLFLLAVSVIWSIEPQLSFQAVRRLVTLAVFYMLVIRLIDTQMKFRILVTVMAVGCSVAACFAVISYVQGTAVFDTQTGVTIEGSLRASGMSLDSNFFAATILTVLPFCLLLLPVERIAGLRVAFVIAAILVVLGTIYSFSRGGALTLGIILLAVFGNWLRQLKGRSLGFALGGGILALVILLLAAPASYFNRVESLGTPMEGDESIRGRWLYVQYGREAVMEHPVGVGAGAFPVAFRQSRFNSLYSYYNVEAGEQQGRSAHNMYLEVAVESGILGGLLLATMIAFALFESLRTERHLVRKDERDAWLIAANRAAAIGLGSFAFAGLFLSAQYEKILWLMLALVPVLRNLAWEGEVFAPDMRKLRRALARRGDA